MAGVGRTAALAAITGLILVVTLTPVPGAIAGPRVEQISVRELADALANILFFVPFGVAAALRFGGWTRPIAAAAGLTLAIELAQVMIPGRYASPSDVVCNTLGAAAGTMLVQRFDMWARPIAPLRWLLPAAAVVGTVTALMGGAFLFQPDIPRATLFGQWTAEFANMAHYEGRVISARVGTMLVHSRRSGASDSLRHRLLMGDTIRVDFIGGREPQAIAPIFSIFDDRAREVLLIGADGDDAIVRRRTLATRVRLDERDLRVADAFRSVAAGDTVLLRFYPQPAGYCLEVNGERHCNLGFTVGDTWGLLLYPVPRGFAMILPYIWLAALGFPAGFWVRSSAGLFAVGVLLSVTLIATPQFAGILATPVPQIAAAIGGLALGSALGRRVAANGRRATSPAA